MLFVFHCNLIRTKYLSISITGVNRKIYGLLFYTEIFLLGAFQNAISSSYHHHLWEIKVLRKRKFEYKFRLHTFLLMNCITSDNYFYTVLKLVVVTSNVRRWLCLLKHIGLLYSVHLNLIPLSTWIFIKPPQIYNSFFCSFNTVSI